MVETYHLAYVILGLAIFGAAVLPRLLSHRPLSLPIIYVAGGYALFSLPHGVGPPDMVGNSGVVEVLTELVVIIALMGAGLKIDRPFSWRGWSVTWRLLAVVMPLTIAATVLLGYWVIGLQVATAVLLGAVIAPTDPVLAADIESGPPLTELEEEEASGEEPEDVQEHSVRFALSSEAGLNDGLAFPFTNLAILLAAASAPAGFAWLTEWTLYYVLYKIVVGVVTGIVLGYLGGVVIFRLPASSRVAEAMAGAEALSGTLIIYGLTEAVGGYGFIAVFVGALVVRQFEWEHHYYRTLNDFAVMVERLLMAVVLVLFGGAVAGGLLRPLTWTGIGVGLAILLLVRPIAGAIGLWGSDLAWPSRLVIGSYGIRGIGSFYYLSYALNEATFEEFELVIAADRLWALLGFVVLASILLHGVTASAVMDAFERWEDRRQAEAAADSGGAGPGFEGPEEGE
ncbi:cation:proton antiporter [Halomicrobium salinisoli]|uniref:cation:proton antiporter n=1 Tax=Halomicrobium salinisoli TaxID=2878391 RepID=UPI001CEFF178|nr:cation:proton antiporter [Halomicrobium salinisoli]